MNFYKLLSTFVGHFALLDPDPDSEYGSGSTDPIEYGSNTDPDPGSGSTTLMRGTVFSLQRQVRYTFVRLYKRYVRPHLVSMVTRKYCHLT